MPQTKAERDRILCAVRAYVAEGELTPPLSLHELYVHADAVIAALGLDPVYRKFVTVLVGSATSSRAILKAIQALGAERVCFGTDAPFQMMHVVLAAYNALLDGAVSATEKALVMGGNIARLFRL